MKAKPDLINCALILAAGNSLRMGLMESHKALLPLYSPSSNSDGADNIGEPTTTFFSRHVELISQNGICKIFVVTRESSEVAFGSDGKVTVKVVRSRFSELTVGSSLSLLCGLEAAQAWGGINTGVLVMDADIIYEKALLEAVAVGCDRSRLFTIDQVAGDTEEVRVYGYSAARPVLIGKGLPPTLTTNLVLLGESLGIIYLAPSEVHYCINLIRWLAGEPPNLKGFGFSGAISEHEEVWQYLFNLGRLTIGRLPGSLLFSDCDSPDDYAYIRDNLFPAIVQRERT